ncbi:CxC2 domain-containing protein [Mycena venus]|uniref:CxC2 domain-containing protein n=1 Tax=Mycena venus TaxID=2733690 RepID=A0A8H7D8T8_9AGAR|nr:CxC2 domain-containing protein [Mycena venus]
MKRTGSKKKTDCSKSLLATGVPTYKITYHTDVGTKSEERYVENADGPGPPPNIFETPLEMSAEDPSLPFADATAAAEEAPGAVPAYETTVPCDEKGAKLRQTVAHMDELKAQQPVILQILLSLHYNSLLLTPCSCGIALHVRKVACTECLQAELLCRQCWLNKHRTMPTHWALIWNTTERFFEKHDFSRVLKNAAIALGHYGERCPEADLARTFTLVESNGIHASAISFCRCRTLDGQRGAPEFQQLLRAGIFPGSVKEPKTGYTLSLLEYYRQLRNQGKGSAYNFVLVLQRLADPFFAGSVPDIYANFLAITRFHQHLDIIMRRGHAHGIEEPLPGESNRPYPNHPAGYLGLQCAACPERGVNMPLLVNVPKYLRHLISQNLTLDGNFKANLFFKHDDGSDKALTDGTMYFPSQTEFEGIAKTYVVPEEDKEVPCKAHIGSIRHQGQVKYGNTAVSGVVACACDHAVAGSFVDLLKGEAFALGTDSFFSYDSWCSFVVNQVTRAIALFPEETWFHDLLASVEGQIPADHIPGHGIDCQSIWQAVYFACRAHFHGETAEMLWAFLNPLGSSTRQMTGAGRHDIINFVMDAWNTQKVLRQADLLAAERLDALRLFELHMAVVEDLSRQHATEVVVRSVYQHETTKVLTIENTLASMVAEEREKLTREDGHEARTPIAQWIHDGMSLERQQTLVITLLKSHREHPLQETWATITKLRDSLNIDLKKFRETQWMIYPRLKLSALDVDEPELTAIQLPSYRMKHGQRVATGLDATDEDSELWEAEVKLRCSEASSGILAVRAASLALSAVKKARDLDYRSQAGITRSQRNLQKAEMMKSFEITMYNWARAALIHLGYMAKDAVEPYPPLSYRDTQRKETHLHHARGDSRLFDGTAWYLQSGVTISRAAVASSLSPINGGHDSEGDEPQLLAGYTRSPRAPKRLKDIAPEKVVVESSASEAEVSDLDMSPSKPGKQQRAKERGKKKKTKKSDGWIWLESLTRGQNLGGDEKLADVLGDHVQWFRAEAEMYRWLEQYERKHAELMRVIERFRRDSAVWAGLAGREERNRGPNGAAAFARMQAAMYSRLEHNARVIFKSAESGAHHDWVSATTFDELVIKIDAWRDVVFKWMDEMDIYRAYKDF